VSFHSSIIDIYNLMTLHWSS